MSDREAIAGSQAKPGESPQPANISQETVARAISELRETLEALERAATPARSTQPSGERSGMPIFGKTTQERLVIRDIWLYAALAFGVGACISIALAGFAPEILGLLAFVAVSGAVILHLDTLDRVRQARRKGSSPDLTRIFG